MRFLGARRPIGSAVLAWVALATSNSAWAQTEWTYRARASVEGTASRVNTASPLVSATGPSGVDLSWGFLGSVDSSWTVGERVRLSGGALVTATSARSLDLKAREAYGRLSASPWLDIEAGRRLLRWGVGYGFSPTGVLDPPRNSVDPNDRLGRNIGLTLVRADLFWRDSSLTIAAASGDRRLAVRGRTMMRGVEVAVIASAARGVRPAYGANVTHVIGNRLEWHGELLAHERDGAANRRLSVVAGLQYTLGASANVVVEYHRNSRGLSDREWDVLTSGGGAARATSPHSGTRAVSRQQFLFARLARAGSEDALAPELIVIAGIDDGSVTVVPGITWTLHRRIQAYVRAVHLAGGPRSIARFAPWSTSLTIGTAVRF